MRSLKRDIEKRIAGCAAVITQESNIWCLARLPQHIERLLDEKDLKDRFEALEEYKGYERVFFLNDEALQMYSEGGIKLEILKKVSAAEMPKGCTRTLRGPYIK